MQNEIYTSALFMLAGLWLFGAIHHGISSKWGRRRPVERSQQLFAVFCVLMTGYLVVRAISHPPLAHDALSVVWRVKIVIAALAFAVVPWLVVACTGARPLWPRTALSVYFLVIALIAVGIPGTGPLADGLGRWPATGAPRAPFPQAALPYVALLSGLAAAQLHGVLACLKRYRSGARRRALGFGTALGVFALGTALELMRVLGLVDTSPAFELSLLATVVLMSAAVGHDRRLNRKRMQTLLDHVPAMVTLKDRDGCYLFANKAFRDHHSAGMDQLRGRSDLELLARVGAMGNLAADADALATGNEVETEDRVQSPEGIRILHSLRFPVSDANGYICALGCVSMDVTALRNAELEALELRHQLAHMDRVTRLDTISASLAHELMQPLAATLTNAQAGLRLLEAPPPSMAQIREVLVDIAADTKRASQVVMTLRDMTRRTMSAQEPVDLGNAADEVLDMIGTDMAMKGTICRRHLAPDCIAMASKPQIQQVVLNLLLNALHAVERQPERQRQIEVHAGPNSSGALQVSVWDSGPGIAASEISRVFDPFYSTKPEGMGMGLAVCRRIIEMHDGRIWAENNETDAGTTFSFMLPPHPSTLASRRAAGGGQGL